MCTPFFQFAEVHVVTSHVLAEVLVVDCAIAIGGSCVWAPYCSALEEVLVVAPLVLGEILVYNSAVFRGRFLCRLRGVFPFA